MPIYKENENFLLRSTLVFALLWLSIGVNYLYSQVPSYVPTNGLVGWWPFNGNANDESGNGNNGVVNGATLTLDRNGAALSAYSFDGINDYIYVPNSSSISVQGSLSMSFWMYMNGGSCNPRIMEINQNLNSCGGYGFAVNGTSNQSRSIHYTSFGSCTNSVGLVNTSNSITSLNWHHVVVSINGTTGTGIVYVDGAVFQTMSGSTIPTFSYNNNALTFGNINANRCDWWGGYIDDIGIWNRALTQTEMSALFSAQSSSPCTANIITQDTTICIGSSVTLRAPALTTTTVPSAGNCTNGIGTWEQLFTSAQLSGYSINRTNGYAFDTATGIYYSVSGSTTLKLDLVNKTITPFTQSGQNSSFSHGIFNYLDQKLYAHRVGRDVVYNVPKAGGAWTVYGSGSFDANSYGSQPFFDAHNNRVGFFGGYGFFSVKNWVYESTSTGWVNPYANNNNCNPARRNATGIAPSKDYRKMYIFSGAGNCNGSQTATSCTLGQAWASDVGKWCWLQDLYEYDFTTHSFTTILPTASPSISQEGSFAYNYDTDVFYILGGFTPPATYSATWGNTAPYTNTVLMMDRGAGATSFSQVSICGTPPPVGTVSSSQGMAFYDGPRDRIIWMRPDGIWALNLNTSTTSTTSTTSSRLWSTGDTSQTIVVTPTQTTNYILTITQNGVSCNDTVTVYVNNPSINSSQTTFCQPGDSILLWTPNANHQVAAPTCTTGYVGTINAYVAGQVIPGYMYSGSFNGHHYYKANNPSSWIDAANSAKNAGGHLVCIDDATEQSFVQNLSTSNMWIGYYRTSNSDPWKWVNCQNTTYTNWRSGEPGNNEHYTHILTNSCFGPDQWNNLDNISTNGVCYSNCYGILEIDPNLIIAPTNIQVLSWSTGQTGDSVWVTPNGTTTYSVTSVLNGVTCSDTITVHVSNLQQNFDPLPDTLIVCTGQSTFVHAGPGYTSYQWSDATTDSVKTINTTGTYWVTVTDSLGCEASDTIWVYFSDLVASITKQNDVYCFGGSNGAISLTTFGGQPPHNITWSTGQTGVSGLANLGAGVYWVTVTDAFGCVRRDTVAVGQPTAPLSVNVAVNNVSCFGGSTGSLISVVSGGTAPYTYSWNTVPAQTTSTASNLPAGSYTLFITDANGCNLTVTGVITQPSAPLSASVTGTNVLCFGGTSGTANVQATGGTAPYSYSWNTIPVQTTPTATNLASGTYTVTITDSKNCQTIQSVTINQPNAPLGGTISTTTVNCFGGSNGSATVTPSGGTGPYNFIWTTIPAQTGATASNLPAGTYSVLITDANNCSITRTATVTQPGSALAVSSTFTPVLCFGDATGSATVLASGGTAPYTYQWASIPGLVSNSATNLSAGTYVVLVTDAKGCTQQTNIIVTQPSAPLTGTLTVTDVACYGDATGSVTVNMSGGTAPYSYSWPAIPGISSNSATNLSSGTYTVNVTDANSCTFSLSGTVNQPLAPLQVTSSGQDALCFAAPSGFAQVAPSGGTAPYSFNWNTIPAQTTPVASNLPAGTYTCTVTDANGCVQFGVWTVGQPIPLMGSSIANDVSCRGAQDGSIQVAISGGTGNYTITWPNGSNSLNRYQLGPGTYSYTITDENNCSFIGAATINEPDPFRVTIDTVSPKCVSTEDGRITVSATGGNGGLTYYINGQVFNGIADGLGVFPYGITIVDQNGCDTSFVVDLSPVYEPCVEIPNWFSPNQNGENELWVIQGFELEELNLIVFNVWGQIVYQTDSDNYVPWDGTYEGVPLPNGDYYYVMTSRDERKYYSGYVTILR